MVAAGLLATIGVGCPLPVRAGAQVEEPLADSVRSVLSAASANQAPPKPAFNTIGSPIFDGSER